MLLNPIITGAEQYGRARSNKKNVSRHASSPPQIMCHFTTSLPAFMNTDNVAGQTLTDVSVRSNTVGMFSPAWRDKGDLRRNYYDQIWQRGDNKGHSCSAVRLNSIMFALTQKECVSELLLRNNSLFKYN